MTDRIEVPFIGGGYLGRSLNIDSQRCVNLYPVADKEGGRVLTLDGTPGLVPVYNPAITTTTIYSAAQTDDGVCNTFGQYFYNLGYLAIGKSSIIYNQRNWLRFISPIEQYAGIVSCYLEVKCSASKTYSVDNVPRVKIHFNDEDNPTYPPDITTLLNLSLTTAYTEWDASNSLLVSGTWYDSPDFAAALQEVVNRPGYSSGSAIMVLLVDNNSLSDGLPGAPGQRFFYEYGGGNPPKLHISYATG